VPARGFARRARAAPGITRSGTTAGVRGAASGLGQEGAGNARLANRGSPRPRKPGLELSRQGDNRPARAAMERREASASRLIGRAPRPKPRRTVTFVRGGADRDYASLGVPSPFLFSFLRSPDERSDIRERS